MNPVQATTTTARPRPGERIIAAVSRDPRTAARATRNDALLAAVTALLAVAMGLLTDEARSPDALGWTLLLAAQVPLVWRRRRPLLVLALVVALMVPYHALDNNHVAPTPAACVALYTVAVTGRPLRTLATGIAVLTVSVNVMLTVDTHQAVELLRISGWVIAVLFFGVAVRYYRQYVAAIVERAERAERTREEEARRRVAEERLRIARDLHDLLAHSITLVGVQTSVAAHVLAADPERLDRAAVAKALDDIAETCRSARGELRTTLEVLRASEYGSVYGGEGRGPLPGLDGVPDLVAAARTAGAEVAAAVAVGAGDVPSAVGAAAYRIVQEALTNAVRHAGPDVSVQVELRAEDWALRVTVTDDGVGDSDSGGTPGFGLIGMRERARSVGGTLEAGARKGGGFGVWAVLPTGAGGAARTGEREGARDLEAVGGSEGVRDREAVRGSEAVRDPDAVRGSEAVRASDPPVTEPGPGPGPAPLPAPEPERGEPR
ncbi:two-component sensor histidine kinase [Streptomyces dengpaensis]|uniref:histidine kinase n=1 Tax=Streptomyces dengpaensis TaxID=2049881 RepID=A0ABN5I9B2_9ACTN|nr:MULTISPECIES: histidine kinase [Streptomyces]AVH58837.1 two-component sensor histidine kinase [Streptomyces dengpaensis]